MINNRNFIQTSILSVHWLVYEGNCECHKVLVKKWEDLIQMNIWQKHSPPHFATNSRCVQLVLVHRTFVPILHS